MTLKFYYDFMSQPSRAVFMFLKATGINFVDCPIALRKGEHLTEEYAKINPLKMVPVIVDDGFALTESVAIMKYLALKHKVPDHWYPSDAKRQAKMDEYLNWQHLGLRARAAQYFLYKVLLPRLKGQPVDEKKLSQLKADLDKTLDHIEKVFLRDSPFVNGFNDVSIADLLTVAELEQPLAANYDFLTNRPVLAAYMKRVQDRLNPHYDFAHQYIRKIRESVIKGKL